MKEIGTDTLGFKWIDMDMFQGLYTTGKRKSEGFLLSGLLPDTQT